MVIKIRPEISKKNKYYLNKHRYYELKYFCLQYPEWKKEYSYLSEAVPATSKFGHIRMSSVPSDPTVSNVILREKYISKVRMIEKAAKNADEYLYEYILKAVTEGLSYTYLRNVLKMPCSRDMYYDRYRRFFWLLSNMKGW
jgi:hypothetical protein